ncbi:fungal hydrophobin-domain-containing protein [Hypoxylon cercidicola]|nr:fungal hydrophobin-domain-containing protein [Hypoxylon cercidicola]
MQIKAFLPIVLAAVAVASPVANPNYPTTTVQYTTSTPKAQDPVTTAYPTTTVKTVYATPDPDPTSTKTKAHKEKEHKTKDHKSKSKKSDYPATTPTYASATPTATGGLSSICPGGATPLCCQLDVDGILDLTCGSPSQDLSSIQELHEVCAAGGLTAKCCTLSMFGSGLLCTTV